MRPTHINTYCVGVCERVLILELHSLDINFKQTTYGNDVHSMNIMCIKEFRNIYKTE